MLADKTSHSYRSAALCSWVAINIAPLRGETAVVLLRRRKVNFYLVAALLGCASVVSKVLRKPSPQSSPACLRRADNEMKLIL